MIRSVRNRLALWYGVIFSGLFLLAFYWIHNDLRRHLVAQMDQQIVEKVKRNQWFGDDVPLEKINKNISYNQEIEGYKMVFCILFDQDGSKKAESDLSKWGVFELDSELIEKIRRWDGTQKLPSELKKMHPRKIWHWNEKNVVFFETSRTSEFPYRVGYVRLNNDRVLLLGMNLAKTEWFLGRLQRTFWILFATSIFIGGIIGLVLGGKAMSGVKRVTRTADRAARGNLSERVEIRNDGLEIEDLAKTFNLMLDKIQGLLQGLRQVSDDIAHDLRTPVTRIRSTAEMAATSTKDADCQCQMGVIVEECDQLVQMINTMLEIAQTDSGARSVEMEKLDLSPILQEGFELFESMMEDKNIQHSIFLPGDQVWVYGNKTRLQRLFANLLDNAIKFTGNAGSVSLRAATVSNPDGKSEIRVDIEDTGVGIADDEQERIFDRFYRGDPSRNIAGNGLGLCLARSIVRSHCGRIELKSQVGKGSCFSVSIPLV